MTVLIYPEPKIKCPGISNGRLADRLLAFHLIQTTCYVLRVTDAKIPQTCFEFMYKYVYTYVVNTSAY